MLPKTNTTTTKEMIKISSNISQVASSLHTRLNEFKGNIQDKVTRAVATTMLGEVKDRIHERGEKADGSQIGTYENEYLKRRQKKPYNRTGDSKIIFSLTRKMENEFSVIAEGTQVAYIKDNQLIENTSVHAKKYGLGWLDGSSDDTVSNFDKSKFLEERFGKVYKLSDREKTLIKPVAEQQTKEELRRLNLL